ncbi:cobyric acid synthase [Clostridium sp. 'deep sea']|uniref:cobyric acid synthase n=1 Tax=Clostridium sp. 'deep sea' TaxID=2779445 RepID=UPI001FAC5835|nr:cobyric acid synthase [Clostridium sp. 'deep sea']
MKNKALMILGTASDVGKSILCTGLCRVFKQDGYKVSPFKSQNMALNSYITNNGKEIGRSQGIQAEAAGVEANEYMNPILLKPSGEMNSQVVLLGKPLSNMSAREYRAQFLTNAREIVQIAINHNKQNNDIMVMEGAGSPVEINLKDKDIVNMKAAEMADAPVILVSDIDRGGVFASIVGTLTLLNEEERARVKGLVINKFRGDVSLLKPGLDWIEQYTQKPVLGVIPYVRDLDIDAEDSVVLDSTKHGYGEYASVQIAVMHLPLISNFTDIDSLKKEPDCNVYFVSNLGQFGSPDIVVIPGSKNTLADMNFLNKTGLAQRIKAFANSGGTVIGICGGYQMLGEKIIDSKAIESALNQVNGIGLLAVTTIFEQHKVTTRTKAVLPANTLPYIKQDITIDGYEIHMGKSNLLKNDCLLLVTERAGQKVQDTDGAISNDGKIFGTYFHGIFDNGLLRRSLINNIRKNKGLAELTEPIYDHIEAREKAFNRLAEHFRSHLNMEKIYEILDLQ